jgi:hypothetical protein
MRLARKLIVSKRGLAIAEKGDESDDDTLAKYESAFDDPLSPAQIGALTALAKGARRRGRSAAALTPATSLISPVK